MKLTIRTQRAKTWDYNYLVDGELDTVTNPDSDVTDHQYLSDGRLKKIVLDNTATREFFYQDTNDSHAYVANKNSHLRKTLDKKSGGATICSFAYELDAAGMRRSITDKDDKYRAFGYDPKYQLKAETFWSAKVPGTRSDALLWSYDGNGNRLTQHDSGVLTPYVYGDNNEMTDAGPEEFTFDHFGNTASIVNIESYSYDFEGHMTQREDLSIEAIDNHEYDGNGRRMRSKLNSAANWTNFIHDELTENLICEYTLVSGTYSIKALNTYGLGLISTNRESTIRYFHFDGLGTTAHLSDTSQNVTDSYSYNAFGNPLSASGSSVNPYRYVGQWGYYDDGAMGSSSGMLLLGVRYYWPRYGRFTIIDPRYWTESYFYCSNSCSMKIDPSGMRSFTDLIVGPTLSLPRLRRPRVTVRPFYGRYCGPQNNRETRRPLDDLDRCCEEHDNCWLRHGCNAFNQGLFADCAVCTLILCACALRARCSLISALVGNCLGAKAGVIGYACFSVGWRQKLQISIFGAPNCHGGY